MRRAAVLIALLATGCATVTPVVKYTCLGCQMLVSSGVCNYVRGPQGEKVLIPECKPGEVAVILNWKATVEKGAAPILGCAKEKK